MKGASCPSLVSFLTASQIMSGLKGLYTPLSPEAVTNVMPVRLSCRKALESPGNL